MTLKCVDKKNSDSIDIKPNDGLSNNYIKMIILKVSIYLLKINMLKIRDLFLHFIESDSPSSA
jgi:hypothetical protein